MENRFISKHFKHYKELKQNEFCLKGGVRGDAFMVTGDIENNVNKLKIKYKDSCVNVAIYDKKLVNRLSPDKIDSCFFWKKAIEAFPYLSVCCEPRATNIAELNDYSTEIIHEPIGAIEELKKIIENKTSNPKMLEIGPGYGNILNFLINNNSEKNYYAIDVNPLFKYKRLFKTDGKTIPDKIPNDLDAVYSINVFQHLSPKQRMSYYKQIKKKLAVGGKFIFSMFVVDSESEKSVFRNNQGEYNKLFGIIDKDNNCYTNFFGQLTRCNRIEELEDIFKKLNMDFKVIHKHSNHYTMIATKR